MTHIYQEGSVKLIFFCPFFTIGDIFFFLKFCKLAFIHAINCVQKILVEKAPATTSFYKQRSTHKKVMLNRTQQKTYLKGNALSLVQK